MYKVFFAKARCLANVILDLRPDSKSLGCQLEAQKKHTAQLSEMTERINVAVAANNLLRKEVNELKDLIIRNHLQNTNHVSGFEDEL